MLNLAVGIVGSEDNPANLIYASVIAVAAFGSAIAGFRPLPMARVMVAAALVQVAAFVAALAGGLGFTGPITVFFSALWLISAWLLRRASPDSPERLKAPEIVPARARRDRPAAHRRDRR